MKSETNLGCMWEQGIKNKIIFMAETLKVIKSANQAIVYSSLFPPKV